jgi:four helix bundle protein
MKLEDFEVYKFSRELSRDAWAIYNPLSWQDKKIIGDQFIRAVDSIGANIAEAWGRYHFLDKNRFYYNARGSLMESSRWVSLVTERNFISDQNSNLLKSKIATIHHMLNVVINTTRAKSKEIT